MPDLTDLTFESHGDIEPTSANPANIPVNICLEPPDPDREEDDDPWRFNWKLSAQNYMPCKERLSRVCAPSYEIYAKDRETLVAIVQRCWLPLYQAAVNALTTMTPESSGDFVLIRWKE